MSNPADAAIAAATRRNLHLVNATSVLTPFDAMVAAEEAMPGDEKLIRQEAISKWVEWLAEDGPDLKRMVMRMYSFVRAYRPDLLRNMSGAEIAAQFGQTRAAESARTRRVTEKTLKKAGYHCTAIPFQKSATTRAKCSKAQMGNRNRAKKAA